MGRVWFGMGGCVVSFPKGDGPRPGDRVRVTYEGIYEAGAHGALLVPAGSPKRSIFDDATVEVLKRADDPTIGEIRRVAPSLNGESKQAVKVGSFLSTSPGERFMWVIVETGEMLADGDVSGLGVVIGAVPESPAARLLSTDQKVSEHGEKRKARKVFVLENAAEEWEPDEDVNVWQWLDSDTPWKYLHRVGDGWLWGLTAETPPAQAGPNSFVGATKACLGRYEEVLS